MSLLNPSRFLTGAHSVALAEATLAALPTATATSAPACVLAPQLRDVSVVQAVGSYSPLVRGKEALVRSYLSLPSCAAKGSSIAGSVRFTTRPGSTAPISSIVEKRTNALRILVREVERLRGMR